MNDRPNPYRTVEGWAKMPAGRTWGSTSAVAIDKDSESVWVAERCGQNSCVGSDLDPVLLFDKQGNLVRSFGKGMVNWPHGIHVDFEGNVWVVDGRDNRPVRPRNAPADAPMPPEPAHVFGHQVIKFSPRGEVLLRLGTDGGAREPGYFFQPNAVFVAPNGDIYVAEGHASGPTANARVLTFDRTGKPLASWGKKGTGPLEFDQPHALAMDSRGRLFVADRSNSRIQILSQDGTLLDTWHQFSRISGGHAKHWSKHCSKYNACGRPVYFVKDSWYNDVYVPHQQARNAQYAKQHGEKHGEKQGKGNKNGKHGHGKGHD